MKIRPCICGADDIGVHADVVGFSTMYTLACCDLCSYTAVFQSRSEKDVIRQWNNWVVSELEYEEE